MIPWIKERVPWNERKIESEIIFQVSISFTKTFSPQIKRFQEFEWFNSI